MSSRSHCRNARALGALVLIDRGPGGVHVVDERFDPRAHRPKVPYRGADISERLAKIRFKGVEFIRMETIDLRVYHDLRPIGAALKIRDAPRCVLRGPQHHVVHRVQRQFSARQRHEEGVDDEGLSGWRI